MSDVCTLLKFNRDQIMEAVEKNDKQRFTVKFIDGKEYIRANQGHSIPVPDLELKRINSLEDMPVGENGQTVSRVIHGTYRDAWKSIRKEGLSRMNRNHIHFAIGTPGESHVISGMRSSAQVLIYIDLSKALHEGYAFYISDNNVVLCPGNAEGIVETKHFLSVIDSSSGLPFDELFPAPLE